MKNISSNMEEALADLGVTNTTLSAEEKRSIDEQGFVIFPDMVHKTWLNELQDGYENLMEKEGKSAGFEVHQEEGTRRLADLVNKGHEFDGIYTHPKVLAAAHQILKRDFKLFSLNGRDATPGHGHQGLHADWGRRDENEQYHVVNVVWMLDDFTPENGATRVVPGTHRLAGSPGDYMEDPSDPHPDQVLLLAPAGSVAVFNAHVWHGGTKNISSKTRRGLFSAYVGREHGQQLDQKEYIRVVTYNRISPAARYILDV
jgi:hypothetical protein